MPDEDTIQLDIETLQALRDEIRELRRENQRLRGQDSPDALPLTEDQTRLLARVTEAWQGFWTRGGANPPLARDRGDGSLAWLQEALESAFREYSEGLETPVLTEAQMAEVGDISSAYSQVALLRHEVERLRHEGTCRYAGPGRGDCEHFVGLPGESIPGQHDGDDDTVDHYGKPNGWCWHCWHGHQRTMLERRLREVEENAEQLRTQLAGCLMAAEGATNPEMSQIAEQGDYGWSLAYETTLQLHRAYEEALRRLRVYTGESQESEGDVERPSRWDVLGSS